MVPVEGVSPSALTDTFHEARSGGRIHMATDILAMRGTPVLAAAPGRIIKLANGGAGGITIYVADASGRYLEYYAHLTGYAPNVKEGLQVEEGDVIGALGGELSQVSITELRDDVFYVELVFSDGTTVSARPSDAIALALRTGTAIVGDESVLAAAGIAIPDEDEDEVVRFREFLDNISADDFAGSEGDEPKPETS